jgi:hypothetical protein
MQARLLTISYVPVKLAKHTYLTGSIEELRLTILGESLFFSFLSQPTDFGSPMRQETSLNG